MPFIPESELPELVKKNRKIYDKDVDIEWIRGLIDHVASVIDETYFRSRFVGFREMPKRNNPERPLIYAGNHSGMAFPWDAIIFHLGLFKKHGYDDANLIRPLSAPVLSQTRLMSPFMVPNIWKKAGSVDATTLNLETMMEYSKNDLLIYPEGVPGIGKGFNKRYQLQRFSTSFVRMSIKYRTDIIPFVTVNGEYINPYVYSFDWLNKLVNKIGVPYLPFGVLTLFLILQPWIFYSAWPAKLIYVRGQRIKPYEMTDTPYQELTRDELEEITNRVRADMQMQIDQAVEEWGKEPFQIKEFLRKLWQNFRRVPYNLPFGWAFLFLEFERVYNKKHQRPDKIKMGIFSTLRIILKNPILIAYFIPIIGWIPILIVGLRRVK